MRNMTGKLPRMAIAVLAMVAGTSAVVAAAQDIVLARQARYKEIGKSFKAINDQLKSGNPDLAVIKANAPTITRLGQQQNRQNWFPAGTQAGQGLQTAANASIWANASDFNAKRADFARASAGYASVATRNDLEAITAATAAIGNTCKGCHETYRDQDRS